MALALRQEAALTAAEIIEDLSTAEFRPDAVLRAAVDIAGEIAPAVIAVVELAADGGDLTREQGNLLFWGIHVLGSARRTELFQSLMRLVCRRSEDDLESILGGARTETLHKILISVFDGDTSTLIDACADSRVDSFVRWSLIGALARLTFDGTVPRDTTMAFLDRFEREPLAAPDNDAWQGWQDAIYLLGLEDMRERLRAACREGRFLQPEGELEFCEEHLTIACNLEPGDPSLFDQANYRPLGDPVLELQWVGDVNEEEEDQEEEERPDPGRSTALTSDEIDWLGKVFASERMPYGAMSVEQIDGYFCALAIDPDRHRAREAAHAVLGTAREASVFETEEQGRRAARLIARMWNTVTDRLDAHQAHRPILWDSEAPKAQGWARGFVAGMQAPGSKWWNAIDTDAVSTFVVPILGLSLDEGEQKEGLHATPEARAEWIAMLPATTIGLYAAVRLYLERNARQPVRSTKVGRNEPCPCGSGKKFKRCCGSPETSFH